jgi:hypothetical protein
LISILSWLTAGRSPLLGHVLASASFFPALLLTFHRLVFVLAVEHSVGVGREVRLWVVQALLAVMMSASHKSEGFGYCYRRSGHRPAYILIVGPEKQICRDQDIMLGVLVGRIWIEVAFADIPFGFGWVMVRGKKLDGLGSWM